MVYIIGNCYCYVDCFMVTYSNLVFIPKEISQKSFTVGEIKNLERYRRT